MEHATRSLHVHYCCSLYNRIKGQEKWISCNNGKHNIVSIQQNQCMVNTHPKKINKLLIIIIIIIQQPTHVQQECKISTPHTNPHLALTYRVGWTSDVPHCCERKAQSQLICRGKPAACQSWPPTRSYFKALSLLQSYRTGSTKGQAAQKTQHLTHGLCGLNYTGVPTGIFGLLKITVHLASCLIPFALPQTTTMKEYFRLY